MYAYATASGEWVAGLGDPTPMGWITVFAYLVAAVLCFTSAGKPLYSSKDKDYAVDLRFWLILTALMLLFGINKQLDLQTLLTLAVKGLATSVGLYGSRRLFQVVFIACVAIVGIWLSVKFFKRYRRSARRNRLAVFGLGLLVIFVVIRATSFHHIDTLIGLSIGGLKLNWIIELTGIGLIIVAACTHLVRRKRQAVWRTQLSSNRSSKRSNRGRRR